MLANVSTHFLESNKKKKQLVGGAFICDTGASSEYLTTSKVCIENPIYEQEGVGSAEKVIRKPFKQY